MLATSSYSNAQRVPLVLKSSLYKGYVPLYLNHFAIIIIHGFLIINVTIISESVLLPWVSTLHLQDLLFFFFFFGWASSSRLFCSQVPIIIIIIIFFSLPAIGRIIFAPKIYWSFQCFARYAMEAGRKMRYVMFIDLTGPKIQISCDIRQGLL